MCIQYYSYYTICKCEIDIGGKQSCGKSKAPKTIQAKDENGKIIIIPTPKGLPNYCYGTSRVWNKRSYGGMCQNCK